MKREKKFTVTLTTILLLAMLVTPFIPKAAAIIIIHYTDPGRAPAGTPVRVVGEINTPNGTYNIWFYNGTEEVQVKTGKADNFTVNNTFIVPRSIGGYQYVKLRDPAANASATISFIVDQSYYVSATPARIPGEGLNTTLTVALHEGLANTTYNLLINVTDPANSSYTKLLPVTTDAFGVGENTTVYYGDFSGAHTNYTGTYTATVNQTFTNTTFTAGLTNATRYKRLDTVHVRGAGYLQPSEAAWVNITFAGEPIYSENVTAVNGTVEADWPVPLGAITGNYTVILASATTPSTVKPIADVQNFTVMGIIDISPNSGPVGETVRVVGEIGTPGGAYRIRWDGTDVKQGVCPLGSTLVNDTFTVPPAVKGSHDVSLLDVTLSTEYTPFLFTVETSYTLLAEPTWVQEGTQPSITVGVTGGEANKNYSFLVNVTDPTGAFHAANISLTTNNTGSGTETKLYLVHFTDANTNFVGLYAMTANTTPLATGNFTVGLTDKPEYRRLEDVIIQASGYQSNENVTLNIELNGESVSGYPKNLTANGGGVITDFWNLTIDVLPGIYTVNVTSLSTPGTVKTPPDVQNFTVTGAICKIRTLNLDEDPVAGVMVQAFNGTTIVATKESNQSGLAEFRLDAGNYTFKAFWKKGLVQIGSLNKSILASDTFIEENLTVSLVSIGVEVKDEVGTLLPLVGITFEYEYATRVNTTESDSDSFETDYNGIAIAENMLAYINYTIKASRYGNVFNTTLIENVTASLWVNITVPTYSLFVTVLDSKSLPVQNANVSVQEWSTWIPVRSPAVTNTSGSTVFRITFGRYRVTVYNYSAELGGIVIFNKTLVDVIGNQLLVVNCKILNLDFSVKALDFFGQPFPNAEIRIKREGVQLYSGLKTGSNGTITLHNLVGGTYQISLYVGGSLCENRTVNLQASSEETFKIVKYIVIAGYPVGTALFITLILLILLIAPPAIIFTYRKLRMKPKGKKTTEKAETK